MIGTETEEMIFFKSLFTNYQEVLGTKMKSSDFSFDYVVGLTIILLWREVKVSPLPGIFRFVTLQ